MSSMYAVDHDEDQEQVRTRPRRGAISVPRLDLSQEVDLPDDAPKGGQSGGQKFLDWVQKQAGSANDTLKNDSHKQDLGQDFLDSQAGQDPDHRPGSALVDQLRGDDAMLEKDEKIDLLSGWPLPAVKFERGKQKATIKTPALGKIPPPKGLPTLGASIDIPIPAPVPGFFVNIAFKIVPKIELGAGSIEFTREVNEDPWSGIEGKSKWELAGQMGAEASIAAQLQIGLKAGVPKVASLSGGGRATVEAKAALNVGVHGIVDNTPRGGREGEVYLQLDGLGMLTGKITAFIGYEILGFSGDLYEFEFDKLKFDFAKFQFNGQAGAEYKNGKPEFFARGGLQDDEGERSWTKWEWLLGKSVKVNKLDRAKERATEAGGDLAAMKELKETLGPAADMVLRSHEEAEIDLSVQGGKAQLLEPSRVELVEELATLDSEAAELLDKLRAANQAVGSFKGKWAQEMALDRAQAAATTYYDKRNERNEAFKRLQAIEKEQAEAQRAFLHRLTSSSLDEELTKAEDKYVEMYQSNIRLFAKEVIRIDTLTGKRYWELQEQIEEQQQLVDQLEHNSPKGRDATRAALQKHEADRQARRAEAETLAARFPQFAASLPQLPTVEEAFSVSGDLAAALSKWRHSADKAAELTLEIMQWGDVTPMSQVTAARSRLDLLQQEQFLLQRDAIKEKRQQRDMILNERAWGFS